MAWWFKKDKWVLVYKASVPIETLLEGKGEAYFYLYETADGKRKYEMKNDIGANNNPKPLRSFWTDIYPWLQGESCSQIPTYWDKVKTNNKFFIKKIYKRLAGK